MDIIMMITTPSSASEVNTAAYMELKLIVIIMPCNAAVVVMFGVKEGGRSIIWLSL